MKKISFTLAEQDRLRRAMRLVSKRYKKRPPSLVPEFNILMNRPVTTERQDNSLQKKIQRFMDEGRDSRDAVFLNACLDYVSAIFPNLLESFQEPVGNSYFSEVIGQFFLAHPSSGYETALFMQKAESTICGIFNCTKHDFVGSSAHYGYHFDKDYKLVEGDVRSSRLEIRKDQGRNALVADETIQIRPNRTPVNESEIRIYGRKTGALIAHGGAFSAVMHDVARRTPTFYTFYASASDDKPDSRVCELTVNAIEFSRSARWRFAYAGRFLRI